MEADWKPDFTKTDPYEGMPEEYADEVIEKYVPTADRPRPPVPEERLTPEQVRQVEARAEAASQATTADLAVTPPEGDSSDPFPDVIPSEQPDVEDRWRQEATPAVSDGSEPRPRGFRDAQRPPSTTEAAFRRAIGQESEPPQTDSTPSLMKYVAYAGTPLDRTVRYDIHGFLMDNPGSEQMLLDAGFSEEQVAIAGRTPQASGRLATMLAGDIKIDPMATNDQVMSKWNSLSANTKRQLIEDSPEFQRGLRDAARAILPVYGTYYFWDDMSTGWKAASVVGDVVFVAGLLRLPSKMWKGLKVIHADETGTWLRRTGKNTPQLAEVGQYVPGGRTRMLGTKVITPAEVGMSDAQYTRFLKARVNNPYLSPTEWLETEAKTNAWISETLERLRKKQPSKIPSSVPEVGESVIESTEAAARKGQRVLRQPEEARELQRAIEAFNESLATKQPDAIVRSGKTASQIVEEAKRNDAMWRALAAKSLANAQPYGKAEAVSDKDILTLADAWARAQAEKGAPLSDAEMISIVASTLGKKQAARLLKASASDSTTPTHGPGFPLPVSMTDAKAVEGEGTDTSGQTDTSTSTGTSNDTSTDTDTSTGTGTSTKTDTDTDTGTDTDAETGTDTPPDEDTDTSTETKAATGEDTPPPAGPTVADGGKPSGEDKGRRRHRLKLRESGTDRQKRAVIKAAGGAVAWRQGRLRGGDVWKVKYAPYGPHDQLVVLGDPPEGATLVTGPRSAYRTLALKGRPPAVPVKYDSGAVDPVLVPTRSGGVTIRFERDDTVSPREVRVVDGPTETLKARVAKTSRTRKASGARPPDVDLGAGIVETRTRNGRKRHVRLV